MAALHRLPQSSVTTAAGSSYVPSCMTGLGPSSAAAVAGAENRSSVDKFPEGLKVLVVDDDATCLKIVEQMLRLCLYHVTTCSNATVALEILRERKGCFDVVLSDVHMPDMDGYKLLEHVGLEMDLPVIMMSADGSTSAVMKGIRHGACDYLIKPIRAEELKNLWQHVVRKKWNGNKEFEQSGSLEDVDRHRCANDVEYASSVNEEAEGLKGPKKRSNNKEDDDSEPENDDPSASKKARVVWSVELHQQFVSAVNQLGLDKAVPKRILELMNVPGLTRENVASHLQKFRLYLKRLSIGGGPQQPNGMSNTYCGSVEPNIKLGTVGGFDFQALAASGQIPPQTLAALHAELIGRPTPNLGPTAESPNLLHSSLLGPKRVPIENGIVFGQHPVKCQSNIFKQFPTAVLSVDVSSLGAWTNNTHNNPGGFSNQNNNLLMDIMQQQKQLQQQQPVLPESSRSINVQPSCLVAPTQSSTNFQAAGSPASVNQNCSFNRSSIVDYTILSPQSNTAVLSGTSNGDNKTTCVPTGFSALASSSNLSSGSLNGDNKTIRQNPILTVSDARQLHGHVHSLADIQASYGANSGGMLDQGALRNPGYSGKGTSIPIRFAIDEYESPTSNLNHRKLHSENSVMPVKQEPNVEFMGYESLVLQQFPSNDLMSVFTK